MATLVCLVLVACLGISLVDAQSWPGGSGPCGPIAATFNIYNAPDFARRPVAAYLNRTVKLVLRRDITLSQGVVFNANFSCTILTSVGNRTLRSADNSFAVLTVSRAHNVLITDINFATNYTAATAPGPNSDCADPLGCSCAKGKRSLEGGSPNCPTIGVYNSFGVQIVRGTVYGRTDIFYTNYAVVDSMTMRNMQTDEGGTVRISYNGDDVNLLTSEVYVTNNNICGGFSGLITNFNARGVIARNNYFTDFVWSAIRCGDFVSLVGDCMLLTFAYNYMYLNPNLPVLADSTAIYVNGHWVNPGILLKCNYAENTNYAAYLDIATSTVTIDGLVAIRPRSSGVKMNQCGKMNTVKSVVIVQGRGNAGWISCLDCKSYNCNGAPWDGKRKARYSNAIWQTTFPEVGTICDLDEMDGMSCNPPADGGAIGLAASVTAGCSGMPYGNEAQFAIVEPNVTNAATGRVGNANSSLPFFSRECTDPTGQLSAVNFLNNIRTMIYSTVAEVGFLNPAAGDFGFTPGSKIYSYDSKWRSCPRSLIGPKPVDPAVYMKNFNIAPTTPLPPYNPAMQSAI